MFVVDASIALAWCFEDESTASSDDILHRLLLEGGIAPAHWPLEIANALRAVGRDHEVCFAPLSRELRQQWPDDALVVGVGEYGEDGPAFLSLRRERDEGGHRQGDEGVYGFSHANTLYYGRLRREGEPTVSPCGQ